VGELKARTKKGRRTLRVIRRLARWAPGRFFLPNDAGRRAGGSFAYEDTFDQAKATVDVKRDMEAGAPMDRLICGDVGFGKTEVAVRAAFKAVMAGKQMAMLVPTTILALQHLNTFRDRMERYGTSIEVLSRFRSRKDQDSVLADLAEGKVDVLIGTHRILSKDVTFKDLGLLVIDENTLELPQREAPHMRTQVTRSSGYADPGRSIFRFRCAISIIATPPRKTFTSQS
jgi:transcription-repair coupling factor (superfamily II helicase)